MRTLIGLVLLMASMIGHAAGLVVTTHPLYLIAQAVTAGIETPTLLLPANQSGHDIQLRPDERQQLKRANLVLWFGPAYESSLTKVLQGQPNAIALYDLKAFRRLPMRQVQGQPIANSLDPHLWLDPVNAIGIAHALAAVRAMQYPKLAQQYKQNAVQFSQRLLMVVKQAKQQAHPAPYWAYHDAYQYMESSLKLNFKGALTVDADLSLTAGQLKWLIDQHQAMQQRPLCLLAEATIDPAVLRRLQPVRVQTVDETMLGQSDFVTAWQNLAQQVLRCSEISMTNK